MIISGPSHGNKLLAGYVALRAVGIEAHFVDVLLLQTMITFLLYFFAPTPGGSGVAEVLSAAVMSIYVPRELTPLYTMIWRLVLSWFTLAAGGATFHLDRPSFEARRFDVAALRAGAAVAEASLLADLVAGGRSPVPT